MCAYLDMYLPYTLFYNIQLYLLIYGSLNQYHNIIKGGSIYAVVFTSLNAESERKEEANFTKKIGPDFKSH